MPLFVLMSQNSLGQKRYVATIRNNRPRIVAFERYSDARVALTLTKRDPQYVCGRIVSHRTSRADLAEEFRGADVGIDLCSVFGQEDGLGINRSILLNKDKNSGADWRHMRTRLERDFDLDTANDDGDPLSSEF